MLLKCFTFFCIKDNSVETRLTLIKKKWIPFTLITMSYSV